MGSELDILNYVSKIICYRILNFWLNAEIALASVKTTEIFVEQSDTRPHKTLQFKLYTQWEILPFNIPLVPAVPVSRDEDKWKIRVRNF